MRVSYLLTFIISLFCTTISLAQQQKDPVVHAHLVEKSEELNLSKTVINDYIVTKQFVTAHNQVTHTYLQQTVNGIPVANARMTMSTYSNGVELHTASRFIDGIENLQVVSQTSISELDAINHSAEAYEVNYNLDANLVGNEGQDKVYQANSISTQENIKVRKVFVHLDQQLRLAYETDIFYDEINAWWQTRIDAGNGSVLDSITWTLECGFVEDDCGHAHHDHGHGHAEESKLNVAICYDANYEAAPNGYEVFAIPLSDPDAGSRTEETAPWNSAPNASPYGWHDINGNPGPEYTITRGNNVYASEDRDDDNVPGFSPNGGTNLEFLYPLDLATEDPVDYQDVAITNLFYWNNVIHDVMYQYGFDEVAGNFQENNYGNGGLASDNVNADAQDGSGTNNANMSTPVDGSNPRMQMFEWNIPNAITFDVNSPGNIAGAYSVTGASFGPQSGTYTGDVVEAVPADACSAITNGSAISGNVAMIDRGTCTFVNKVQEAQDKGATAVIICNNVSSAPITLGGSSSTITIPSVMMSMSDCNTLKANMPVNVTFTLNGAQIVDSDLDNTVITHEYGHGISIRLTGGANTSSCLSGDEQMGEGWSDWWGLMMSMESSDVATTSRGMGAYLTGEPSTSNGIREYPYTTDMSVNPHTYDDIMGASIPHGVGSVWAAMLWEMTWDLIAVHGFDSDLYNGTGGNNIALELVMDGLKMQPCNPGFIDGRDAIIAADQANNAGANVCLIWDAFARRGLGYSATQGSSGSRSDGVEAFDVPPSCMATLFIEKTAPAVAVSGSTYNYAINVQNNTGSAITNLFVGDTIPTGTVFLPGSLSYGTYNPALNRVEINEPGFAVGAAIASDFDVIQTPPDSSTLSLFDGFELTTNFVSSTGQGSGVFALSTTNPYQGINSFFAPNLPSDNTQFLTSGSLALGANPVFSFWHAYDTENGWDGGYVEISLDGGITWNQIQTDFIQNGYNGGLGASSNADIANKPAFTGDSGGYIRTIIDLKTYANTTVRLRFVFGSDNNTGGNGWDIDDVTHYDGLFIENRVCATSDQGFTSCDTTLTLILPICESYTPYFPDADSDGFGDDGAAIYSCTPISGYTLIGGDCNDFNPAIFPGPHGDICDGADNDCDGLIDENCSGMYICDGSTLFVNFVTQQFYHAENILETDTIVYQNWNTLMTAGDTITLLPGFETLGGINFEARIEGCTNLNPVIGNDDNQGDK